MSEEDYLKRHLQDMEEGKKATQQATQDAQFIANMANENTRISDLQFFNFDIRELPCGQFYPVGTLFMVRPAQVREIQSYSMVDDNNFYDIVEKMNDILQACVRVKYPDGRVASFLEVRDQDRLFLVFLIRELTFQQGGSLSVNTKCECGKENKLELKRESFVFHGIDEKLAKFYNKQNGTYNFKTINGKSFELTPPNIGLQKAFTDYIVKENTEKRSPNLSFLKIIDDLLTHTSNMIIDFLLLFLYLHKM